jgi:hypothetical protein
MTSTRENSRSKHVSRQICFFLDHFQRELRTLVDCIAYDLLQLDELPLLQVLDYLGIWMSSCSLNNPKLFSSGVFYRVRL